MATIGLFCPPTPGHLNPMTVLGTTLLSRGHNVILFGLADVEPRARACGLSFRALGTDEYPVGSVENSVRILGKLRGLQALRYTVDEGRRLADMTCRFAPAQALAAGLDLMIVDQNEPAAGSVAEYLNIPFVTFANLPLNFDPDVPPPFSAWGYDGTMRSRLRNRAAYNVFYWILSPVTQAVNQHRKAWNLPPLGTPDDSFSRIGQICQMTEDFDFPRKVPPNFHYSGLLFQESHETLNVPADALSGQPLVYASMGTLQNRDHSIYHQVAAACAELPVKLLISLGGSGERGELGDLPGDPIVMDYVPQQEVLKRTAVLITHGGLNTVQEALRLGVPMVAIPVTNDQPAVAARVARCGAGCVIPVAKLTVESLSKALKRVLEESSFREAAQQQQQSWHKAGGANRAAELVEQMLTAARGVKTRSAHM